MNTVPNWSRLSTAMVAVPAVVGMALVVVLLIIQAVSA